ncbi:MAG: hypothetical protein JO180_10495, partial [Gemmatirosa sp.]|nr:hypothetical protein [Gemmatirosa sp.]
MTRAPMPPQMPNDPEWSRYARHLAGEGTPADAEQTRRWIAEDAERARAADEARSTWHATAPAVDAAVARRAAVDTDDAWARLAGRLSAAPSAPASSITVRRRWMLPLGAGLAAAAAAALVVVPRLREQSGAPAWRTYATPAGQRASVYLPDGSRADLRANTTLRAAIGRGAGSGPR